MSSPDPLFARRLIWRHRMGKLFEFVCAVSTWSSLAVLAVLLGGIGWKAVGWLDWQFLTSYDSRRAHDAGILAGLVGSVWVVLLTGLFSVPIGVGAAVYLEEYSKDNWFTQFIKINLSNLAGVPSVVYGILGLAAFVRMFNLFPASEHYSLDAWLGFGTLSIPLPFGRTVIAGALTLTLLILPLVIISTQEALRSVPPSIRHCSYALGATRWQTVWHQVLPAATPGIMTGVILALSRATGETAPLIMIGAMTYIAFLPGDVTSVSDLAQHPQKLLDAPFGSFTTIPIQVFNWVSRPGQDYQHVAAAAIVVLLGVLLLLNGVAIFIRYRFQSNIRW